MEALTAWLVVWAKTRAVGWLARHWPKLVATVLVAGSVAVFVAITAVNLVSGTGQDAAAANACTELGYVVDEAVYQPPPVDQVLAIPVGGPVAGFDSEDGDKIANAQTIVTAGVVAGVGRRGLVVAIATALQESGLKNLGYGDRDSLGLFQQRPSQGWGTAEQVRDQRYAALAFFGGPTSPHFNPASGRASPAGLLEVIGWEDLPITVAAQRVQRSAFPGAYAKHEERATVIVDALTGGAPAIASPLSSDRGTSAQSASEGQVVLTAADYRASGMDIDSFCSSSFQLASATRPESTPVEQLIPAGDWTAPLQSRITSPFGNRYHPVLHEWRLHAGTDFHADVGTPVVAPAAGAVRAVSWSSGGGLTVTIAHSERVETLHLHLSQALVKPGDEVQGGQVIALSGDSGVGTGPHYHFAVHVDGRPVDPEPFMWQHGVNLRAWS